MPLHTPCPGPFLATSLSALPSPPFLHVLLKSVSRKNYAVPHAPCQHGSTPHLPPLYPCPSLPRPVTSPLPGALSALAPSLSVCRERGFPQSRLCSSWPPLSPLAHSPSPLHRVLQDAVCLGTTASLMCTIPSPVATSALGARLHCAPSPHPVWLCCAQLHSDTLHMVVFPVLEKKSSFRPPFLFLVLCRRAGKAEPAVASTRGTLPSLRPQTPSLPSTPDTTTSGSRLPYVTSLLSQFQHLLVLHPHSPTHPHSPSLTIFALTETPSLQSTLDTTTSGSVTTAPMSAAYSHSPSPACA